MRRNLLVALTVLAACFHDAGPVGSVPTGTTGTSTSSASSSTGLDETTSPTSSSTSSSTTTSTTTTGVTTLAATTTDETTTAPSTSSTTGPVAPICGDTSCDPDEDCNTCVDDCGPCPLGVPPGGRPDPVCIGDEGSDGPDCNNINGAYTSAAVNVGYYPFRIKPGVGTALHTCDDRSIEALAPGQGFAAQSTHNPACSDNPPLRAAVAGFVFGYSRDSGQSGWVPADALEFVGYDGGACADGPQGAAWQVARNPYDGCKAMACTGVNTCADGNPIDPKDPNKTNTECGGFPFNLSRTIAPPYLPLHATPGTTPSHYLHQGDDIKVLYLNKNGWFFVELKATTCPTLTPIGVRGWVENKAENFGP